MKSTNPFTKKLIKLIDNPFIRKWILLFLLFITAIFACFLIYTYSSSRQQFQKEVTTYSELQTERIAAQLDETFNAYERIAYNLSLTDIVNIYLFGEQPLNALPNLYTQLSQQLLAYRSSDSAVQSIYLYPAAGNGEEVFSSGSNEPQNPSEILHNRDEMYAYPESITEKTIIARKALDFYPFLITIQYPVERADEQAIIVVNVNISNIALLKSEKADTLQSIYIVSDQGEILYRKRQQDIPEPLDTVPQLTHFDASLETFSQYVKEDEPYIYVQQHSEDYPWYYVTVTNTQSYAERNTDIFSSFVSIMPYLLVLTVVAVFWLAKLATHPILTISDFLEDPMAGVPENISEPESEKIIRQLINYIQANQMLSKELTHQMERQQQATFRALQSQINPHFLFNTLNLIRNLEIETLGYDHDAPRLTLKLSKLLRYAINSAERVPMETELQYTTLYMDILNQRYQKKLQCTVEEDPQTSEVLIPKLIIQPLIENAIFHGFADQLDEPSRITISVRKVGDCCSISVADNGVGITEEKLVALREKLKNARDIPSNSIGLQNVVLRMYLIYKDDFSFTIETTSGEGTCITLSFPFQPDDTT